MHYFDTIKDVICQRSFLFELEAIRDWILNITWKEKEIGQLCDRHGNVLPEKEELGGKQSRSIFYSRTVTNQLRYGPLSKDFLPVSSPINLYQNNTLDLYELGLNTLATDYIDNDQVRNHIWTWEPTLSIPFVRANRNSMCTALNASSFRWTVRPCMETHPILCQHTQNHTLFSYGGYVSNPNLYIAPLHSFSSTMLNWTSHCPPVFQFSPPLSA